MRRELGELVRLAAPIIASRLGIMTMGLVDVVVVGRYSTTELGYQALGWAPTAIVMTTAVGLITGVQVVSSQLIGEGRRGETGAVFKLGLVVSAALGLLSTALLIGLGPWGLSHMGLDADLARGASGVLKVLAWSMPFHVVFTAASFYLEALQRPKPATLAMWVCNALNLGLNLLLVPGAWGFPEMGAQGAAWSTFACRVVLTVWLVVYVLSMRDAREWGLSKPFRFSAAESWRLFKPGLGAGASYFVEVSAFNAMNVYAGWLGGLAVAGWSVVLNAAAVIFMLPLGLAGATAVLVGRAYGASDRAGVVRAATLGFGVCVAMLSVVAVGVLLAPAPIASLYTRDPALVALVAPALALCSLFYVADGLQVVAAQALRARGDVWAPTFTHVISYFAVMIPSGWLFAFGLGLGLNGIVWAVIVASAVSAGLLLWRFWRLSVR